jgi:arsenate reductase (glutaredoxin)
MLNIYGIPNCDTVQKTLKWLKSNNLEFEFHDFKKEGVTEQKIKEWLKKVPLSTLLNKVSATYKALPENEKPTNEAETIALFISKPSCIKRPVLENGKEVSVGFKLEVYEKMFL